MNPLIIENGLVISSIWSMDIDDLEKFVPSTEGFMIVVDLSIGREGEKGSDDFRFTLSDKLGLNKYIIDTDHSYIKHGVTTMNNYNLLIIDNYSYSKLELGLREILKSIDVLDNSWTYIASQLNRYFYWEFEKEFRNNLKKQVT